MKIQIIRDNTTYSVEREEFDAELAFDDFLNLLFISGTELQDLENLINILNEKSKQNHKKDESKTIQGFSNI
jgi:hypothetical protein